MRVTEETVDLVKRFEGLELEAYRDPVGIVTIGYGYTNRAGFGPGVKMGDVWSEAQAEAMLREGLERFADKIRPLFKVEPAPHEFGAFLSLAYNIGTGGFARSTALKRFNAGDKLGAAEAMRWWNKAGGDVLRGLERRRDAEVAMLLGPPHSAPLAPPQPDPAEQPGGLWTAILSALAGIFGKGRS